MHYIALAELPQGQQPGDVFEAHEDVGRVFISVGAARAATPEELQPQPSPSRRRYQRRDLEVATS